MCGMLPVVSFAPFSSSMSVKDAGLSPLWHVYSSGVEGCLCCWRHNAIFICPYRPGYRIVENALEKLPTSPSGLISSPLPLNTTLTFQALSVKSPCLVLLIKIQSVNRTAPNCSLFVDTLTSSKELLAKEQISLSLQSLQNFKMIYCSFSHHLCPIDYDIYFPQPCLVPLPCLPLAPPLLVVWLQVPRKRSLLHDEQEDPLFVMIKNQTQARCTASSPCPG